MHTQLHNTSPPIALCSHLSRWVLMTLASGRVWTTFTGWVGFKIWVSCLGFEFETGFYGHHGFGLGFCAPIPENCLPLCTNTSPYTARRQGKGPHEPYLCSNSGMHAARRSHSLFFPYTLHAGPVCVAPAAMLKTLRSWTTT